MTIFASFTLNNFWDDACGPPPEDGFAITVETHQAYLQARSAGQIVDFSTAPPTVLDPPPPAHGQQVAFERIWRNGELQLFDPMAARHRDERDLNGATTLDDTQFAELLDYRQRLRDWPTSAGFPDTDQRPPRPAWLDNVWP